MKQSSLLLAAAFLVAGRGLQGQDDVSLIPHARLEVDRPTALALDRSGRRAAVGSRREGVHVVDLESGRVIRRIPMRGEVRAVEFAPSGEILFVASSDRSITAFDPGTGNEIESRRVSRRPLGLDVGPEGQLLAVAGEDGVVEVMTTSLVPMRSLEAPTLYRRDLRYLAVGQEGREVFAAAEDGSSAFWNRNRGDPIRTGTMNRVDLLAAARDPTGDMLLLGMKSLSLEQVVSNVELGQPVATAAGVPPAGAGGGLRSRLGGGPDVTAFANHSLRVIEWATGKAVRELVGLPGEIRAVAIAPVRTLVASASREGAIHLWNIQQNRLVTSAQIEGEPVALAFSDDGRWMVAVSEAGVVSVWKTSGVGPGPASARFYDTEGLLNRSKYELTTEAEPIFPPGVSYTVAVLGLDNLGVDPVLARTVDNLLMSRLANHPDLRLVERNAIERVVQEVRLQNSGLTTVQDAARIGELLNAERVIVGSVNQLGAAMLVSVRVVATETGRVEGAREVMCNDCSSEDLPRALDILAGSVVDAGGGR